MTQDIARPGHDGPSPSARSLALSALGWTIENNRAVFDRTSDLAKNVASANAQIDGFLTVIRALRGSRTWRLMRLAHEIKRRLFGTTDVESVDAWLTRIVAQRPAPAPPQVEPGLDFPLQYQRWIDEVEPQTQQPLGGAPAAVTLVLPLSGAGEQDLAACLAACLAALAPQLTASSPLLVLAAETADLTVITQTRPDARILTHPAGMSEAEALHRALSGIHTDFIGLLDPRDRPARLALPIIGATLARFPETDILYGDADRIDGTGQRHNPDLRPDWDPELLQGSDLFGGLTVYRTDLLRTGLPGLPDPGWSYALALRAAAQTDAARIRHVPAVLCHRAPRPDSEPQVMCQVLAAHLRAAGQNCAVGPIAEAPGSRRVRHLLPKPPLVSLLIPTRDQAGLLAACLDGVLRLTDYPALEVILVDNGTTHPKARAVLDAAAQDPRVILLHDDAPFNWSALNNRAARAATGEVLVLLNNDTAVIDPGWLTELVSQALRPEIGAVGARLLYQDGRVQHAGIAIDDDGGTKHLFRFRAGDDPGPADVLTIPRSVTAVTGACLAVRRDLYLQIGGPTESLAIASNDVDLCLRFAAMGYRNLWTPFATLEHRELATRGADTTPEMQARAERELRQLRRDWGGALARDPHINANLVVINEDLRLRTLPRP